MDDSRARVTEWVTALQGTSLGAMIEPPDLHRRTFARNDSDSDSDWSEYEDSDDSEAPPELVSFPNRPAAAQSDKDDGLPHWFNPQPFQYNGRVFLLALPVGAFILSLCGDLLLTALLFGGLTVFVLSADSRPNGAMTAYIISLVCCQCIVMFSVFPLVWVSLWSLLLMLLVNMFCVMVGAWGLLHFKTFRFSEPDMAKTIEILLFTMFPMVTVCLWMWMLSSLVGNTIIPFAFTIVGFGVLQIFLQPTLSSFDKLDVVGRDTVPSVLDEGSHTSVVLFYVFLCPGMSLVTDLHTNSAAVFTTQFWVKLVFIGSGSLFLSTFLHTKKLLEHYGVSETAFQRFRLISGLVLLSFVGPLIHSFSSASQLLPLAPAAVLLWAAYSFTVAKKLKLISAALGAALCLVFFLLLWQLSWQLNYSFLGTWLDLRTFYLMSVVLAVVCIVCLYGASALPKELFGGILLVYSGGCIFCLKVLAGQQLVSQPVLSVYLISWSYIIIRLWRTGMLGTRVSLLVMTVNASCFLDLLPSTSIAAEQYRTLWTMWLHVSFFFLSVLVLWIIIFEKQENISMVKCCLYWCLLLVASLCNVPVSMQLSVSVLQRPLTPASCLGLVQLFSGAVFSKISLMHKTHEEVMVYAGPVTMASGVLCLLLQPSVQFTWEAVECWLLLACLLILLLLPYLVKQLKSASSLYILSLLEASCMASSLNRQLYGLDASVMTYLFLGCLTGAAMVMVLLAWQQPGKLKDQMVMLCGIMGLADVGLWMTSDLSRSIFISPAYFISVSAVVIIAVVSKVLAIKGQFENADILHLREKSPKQLLPLIGNIAVLTAFILLVTWCPTANQELWVVGCSVVLILLQRDDFLLQSLNQQNQLAPTIITSILTLLTYSLYTSELWTAKTTLAYFCALLEVMITVLNTPVYFILLTLLWNNTFWISDRTVVFLAPLNTLLFILGSTYTSWVQAVVALASSVWMAYYKLPFKR